MGDGVEDGAMANTNGDGLLAGENVTNADWEGFDLDPELWQYV
jgi:hypothetical protein